MEKKKTPDMRFAECQNNWERRKLGDILKYEQPGPYIVNSTDYDDSYETPVLTAGQSFILGYTDEADGIKNASPDEPVIIFDDFTTSSHFVDFPFKVKSSAMKLLTLKDESDDIYCVKNILQNLDYVPASHERHWISIFADFDVLIPKNKEEQSQIGEFYRNIDNLTALHQKKYDALIKTKKSMLLKMFPQDGATVPEIRFSDFTDAWEQRKLGDVLEVVTRKNGSQFTKEDVLSVSDEFGCVNQIAFQGRSFAGEDISNYKVVDTGDIIYTRSPLRAKPFGIIKIVREETGIVSPLYIVNKAVDGNDAEFLYRAFDLPYKTNNYLSPLVRKGAKNTMNISEEEWLSGNVMVSPLYEEQKKIGEFFKVLDDTITLHQRELETLKNIKTVLLNKMFV